MKRLCDVRWTSSTMYIQPRQSIETESTLVFPDMAEVRDYIVSLEVIAIVLIPLQVHWDPLTHTLNRYMVCSKTGAQRMHALWTYQETLMDWSGHLKYSSGLSWLSPILRLVILITLTFTSPSILFPVVSPGLLFLPTSVS